MSGPELQVTLVHEGARTRVVLRGELDVHSQTVAQDALTQAAGESRDVVLDLRGLDFIDSSGLKLVLMWSRRLGDDGAAFSVIRGPAQVQRPFSSAGLDGLLAFVDGPPA